MIIGHGSGMNKDKSLKSVSLNAVEQVKERFVDQETFYSSASGFSTNQKVSLLMHDFRPHGGLASFLLGQLSRVPPVYRVMLVITGWKTATP